MPELIVPVPLHRTRLRERGYNQAQEIARATAATLSLPLDPHCCERVLVTAPQTRLEKKARRRNVRGAFAVRYAPKAGHVAILDDVLTTGSTASELTKVLLQQGVQRVDLWAVARTP
jgi:ComF family protein